MFPDGGIVRPLPHELGSALIFAQARFRVYGIVVPIFPPTGELLDLAHVLSGGRVVAVSDQHFGVGPNLLLPGRGEILILTVKLPN